MVLELVVEAVPGLDRHVNTLRLSGFVHASNARNVFTGLKFDFD